MPTYLYYCNNCKKDFEIFHKMSEIKKDCINCSNNEKENNIKNTLEKKVQNNLCFKLKGVGVYGNGTQ